MLLCGFQVNNIVFLCGFLLLECTEKLASIMMARSGSNGFNKSSFVDVVLSDMCPSASGHKEIDHDNVIKLCYAALKFTVLHLVTGIISSMFEFL